MRLSPAFRLALLSQNDVDASTLVFCCDSKIVIVLPLFTQWEYVSRTQIYHLKRDEPLYTFYSQCAFLA